MASYPLILSLYFNKRMLRATIEQKQQFLREEIIGRHINPQEFMEFMGTVKGEGDNIDLQHWSLEDLKDVVQKYKQYVNKNKEQLLNSRVSRELKKSKIFEGGKKQKFKYEGTMLMDFEQNYEQECSKSELAFQFPPNTVPSITIDKWELKSVGGFIFGIGSRNQLQLTIGSNFTPNKVIRKLQDCDWLKTILGLRHSGSYVPPLEPSRQFATDDKKGINAKIAEVTLFLNTLLQYEVFSYSIYLKQFLMQQSYRKFHEFTLRESQYAKQKDIIEIQSPSGYFKVQVSDKMNQTIRKTSQLTQQLTSLHGELANSINRLLNDLQLVGRSMKSVHETTIRIGEKYNEVQKIFNYKQVKLGSIIQTMTNASSSLVRNIRQDIKNVNQFCDSFVKLACRDWNELLLFDRRQNNEFKLYLSGKESLLRRKEKHMGDIGRWELPEVDLLKLQKQGISKLSKEEIFDRMFPSDNEKENRTRIWLSFANQNYITSFKQFLLCQQKSLLTNFQAYAEKHLIASAEVSKSFQEAL